MFAADAVARLSGSVGVAAVTAGPGLTNTITAVKNAQMAESPILIIGGCRAVGPISSVTLFRLIIMKFFHTKISNQTQNLNIKRNSFFARLPVKWALFLCCMQ